MKTHHVSTRHARERSGSRSIPPLIVEVILEFGSSIEAGDGAKKYALTKDGMRQLRRAAGRTIVEAVAPYRNRNAYVIAAGNRIITVAYSRTPLFH